MPTIGQAHLLCVLRPAQMHSNINDKLNKVCILAEAFGRYSVNKVHFVANAAGGLRRLNQAWQSRHTGQCRWVVYAQPTMAARDGWATGVVLSVTGVPREQRAAVQDLVERGNGRCAVRSCPVPSAAAAGAPPTARATAAAADDDSWPDRQLLPALLPTCRYSPNLSRRCTHLAVAVSSSSSSGDAGQAGGCSEKLRTAARHQQKWGLELVDFR